MVGFEKVINLLYEHRNDIPKMVELEGDMIVFILTDTLYLNPEKYSVETRMRAFADLLHIVEDCENLDIGEQWGLLTSAVNVHFINTDYDDYVIEIRRAYCSMVDRVERLLQKYDCAAFNEKDDNAVSKGAYIDGPVVIVTSQFLSPRHAPTRTVLEYAYTIITELGIPAVIINDANTHCKYTWSRFYYDPDYNSIDEYNFKGVSIPFYQARNEMLDLSEMEAMCNVIREMNPRLVLNVGAYSIVSDLCRHFVLTASIPCAIDIPVSMSEYLLLPRKTRETDQAVIENLLPYQKLINVNYNYIYPDDATMKYERKLFSVNDDDFVITTVGHRLDKEMDDDFLTMIGRVLSKHEKACFMMIGEVDDKARVKRIVGEHNKTIFAGEIKESGQCLKICDVIVNPERTGGGRTAFEALYQGKPAVTLKYGDVWNVVGDDCAVNDYGEMFKFLDLLISDSDYYREISQKAKERADELEDMGSTFRKLFCELGIM